MKAVLGAEALRRKRAVAVPQQGLSFAAQALSVRHDGLLARRSLNGKRPPLPSTKMNMHRRIEKLPLRWYNEHGFIWFFSGKQMRGRG